MCTDTVKWELYRTKIILAKDVYQFTHKGENWIIRKIASNQWACYRQNTGKGFTFDSYNAAVYWLDKQ